MLVFSSWLGTRVFDSPAVQKCDVLNIHVHTCIGKNTITCEQPTTFYWVKHLCNNQPPFCISHRERNLLNLTVVDTRGLSYKRYIHITITIFSSLSLTPSLCTYLLESVLRTCSQNIWHENTLKYMLHLWTACIHKLTWAVLSWSLCLKFKNIGYTSCS